jgi:colanic acid/amylovoran biosynthesis protein
MEQKNFLLVGGNFINKGAEAMLKTVQAEIFKSYPNANVYVICSTLQRKVAGEQGFIPISFTYSSPWKRKIRILYGNSKSKLTSMLGFKAVPFADVTPERQMREQIKTLDMAIDVSGYAYHDSRDYRQPLETIKIIKFCKEKKAKYLFMPQAWGSFDKPMVAENVRKMLNMSDGFSARDKVSQGYLANLLQKPAEDIELFPDIAFNFPKPDLNIGKVILERAGRKNSERKLLIIGPNMRVYSRFEGAAEQNPYVQKLLNIARYAINDLQMDVALVANEIHVQKESYHSDDRFICNLLKEAINDNEHCFFIDEYFSAQEVKSIIGNGNLVVASRFHALIFALSQGIPSMAISWSHKYRELFSLFEMEKFVLEDSNMESEILINRLSELSSNQKKWQNHIQTTFESIRNKVAKPLSQILLTQKKA